MKQTFEGVEFTSNRECTREELKKYLHYVQTQNKGQQIQTITLSFFADSVHIQSDAIPQPYEHIRRITGYLVGTLDKFNDGKKAEEKDRVKHLRGAQCPNFG